MREPIYRYVNHGVKPGSFLCAVIDNDLLNAVGCADFENLQCLAAFVGYFHNEAPSACHGSREKREAWLEKFKPKAPSSPVRTTRPTSTGELREDEQTRGGMLP
jgi:hypothetical protein